MAKITVFMLFYFKQIFSAFTLGLISFFVLFTASTNLWAQSELTEIEFFKGSNSTNQISYFDNRFRLDALLDEVTFIFYRVPGAAPVILVQPDGAKIKIGQHDKERVSWFEDKTFDMVKIKSPMPGPWQVIGNVLPQSKIMIVTDVKMEVEPLPSLILAGETLKLKAKLFNGKKAIKNIGFRDVVKLNVEFYSTNNALYKNFAADAIPVTTFLDDGRGLDESPGDNVFTGEFNLTMLSGEWIPEYYIVLPTLERKLTQDTIILRPYPVELAITSTSKVEEKHELALTIDSKFVKPDSLLFQGKIIYPKKDPVSFSLMEAQSTRELKKRIVKFDNLEAGSHHIEVSVFGETINGREFRLTLPDLSFNVEAPKVMSEKELLMETMSDDDKLMEEIRQQAIDAEKKLVELKAIQKKEQEERDAKKMMMIIIGNSALFIIAIIGFLVFLFIKKRKKAKLAE